MFVSFGPVGSAGRHGNVDAQLVARVVRQARREALAVVVIGHVVAGDHGLVIGHLLAALHGLVRHVGGRVAVRYRMARDGTDTRTDCGTGDTPVALADLRAKQATGHAAEDGAQVIALRRLLHDLLVLGPALL